MKWNKYTLKTTKMCIRDRVPAARQAAAMTMWLMLITKKYNKLTYQERQ